LDALQGNRIAREPLPEKTQAHLGRRHHALILRFPAALLNITHILALHPAIARISSYALGIKKTALRPKNTVTKTAIIGKKAGHGADNMRP
jgi:hypothetical protein